MKSLSGLYKRQSALTLSYSNPTEDHDLPPHQSKASFNRAY